MKKILNIFKKFSITGEIETEKEFDIDQEIKLELEKVIKDKTEELSNKYYRKIKTRFFLEVE